MQHFFQRREPAGVRVHGDLSNAYIQLDLGNDLKALSIIVMTVSLSNTEHFEMAKIFGGGKGH